MPTKELAGKSITVNDEGYLEDFSEWDRDVAAAIAAEEGISEMSDKHWDVIEFLQKNHREGVPLSIRKIGKSGVVSIQEFYELFPEGPLKKSSKIAGIPKPESCI